MWLDCPRALLDPPTCDGSGELQFSVFGPEWDTNVGPTAEAIGKPCSCDLTEEEWQALEDQAATRYYEGPDEDGA